MNADDLKKRTKQFALRILKLATALPNTIEGKVVRGQLVRAARQWVPTIERRVVGAPEQGSLQSLVLSKRNQTKAPFGWKSSLKVIS